MAVELIGEHWHLGGLGIQLHPIGKGLASTPCHMFLGKNLLDAPIFGEGGIWGVSSAHVAACKAAMNATGESSSTTGRTWDKMLALLSNGIGDCVEAKDGSDQLSGATLTLLIKEKELRELSWDLGAPWDGVEASPLPTG